jgi:hypothetical protein
MTDIEFKILEEYAKVGFRRKDDFSFNAWYLTEAEAQSLRKRVLELIENRGSGFP